MVDSLKPVDYVILDKTETYGPEGYMGDIISIIQKLKPDVFVINDDVSYIDKRKEKIEREGVKFIILERHCPKEFENISTTKIINKILGKKD
jgi:glycerol-3-phosphate cytidylyltransferase-like family protein